MLEKVGVSNLHKFIDLELRFCEQSCRVTSFRLVDLPSLKTIPVSLCPSPELKEIHGDGLFGLVLVNARFCVATASHVGR